jgi:hypothetical protein
VRLACAGRLSPSIARLKLEGFREQWNAELVLQDAAAFVLRVPMAGSFWQRWLTREPALEVRLHLRTPPYGSQALTRVSVELRPLHCDPAHGEQLLAVQAPTVLDSLRAFLQINPEQRGSVRLRFAHALGVFPLLEGEDLGEPVVCRGKDLSAGGIGLYSPQEPPAGRIYVQSLVAPDLAPVAVLAKVVRVEQRDDGTYEVGAAFPDGV